MWSPVQQRDAKANGREKRVWGPLGTTDMSREYWCSYLIPCAIFIIQVQLILTNINGLAVLHTPLSTPPHLFSSLCDGYTRKWRGSLKDPTGFSLHLQSTPPPPSSSSLSTTHRYSALPLFILLNSSTPSIFPTISKSFLLSYSSIRVAGFYVHQVAATKWFILVFNFQIVTKEGLESSQQS